MSLIITTLFELKMADGGGAMFLFPHTKKAERGSGVLSNISCHMEMGPIRKECHDCIYLTSWK